MERLLEISLALRELRIKTILRDDSYQRPLDLLNVARKVIQLEEQSEPFVGLVAKRRNDSLWVVDGQHHIAAARVLGMETLPFLVFQSRGRAEEAHLFSRFLADQRRRAQQRAEQHGRQFDE